MSISIASVTGFASTSSESKNSGSENANEPAIDAVGSILSGLVFSRNMDAATEQGDSPDADQQANRLDQLKQSLGEETILGVEALVECKNDRAFTYARQASALSSPDYALAGLWLEALTEADRKNWFEAKAYFHKIKSRDEDIKTQADYDNALGKASKEITVARKQYGTAKTCRH